MFICIIINIVCIYWVYSVNTLHVPCSANNKYELIVILNFNVKKYYFHIENMFNLFLS